MAKDKKKAATAETETETEPVTEEQAEAPAEEAAADTPESEPTPEDRIAELEEQAAALKDQLLRALAEVENTRRRAELDRQDATRYGAAPLARDLLSVGDNLRRALDSVPEEARTGGDEMLKNFFVGVEMTEKELLAAFSKNYIEKIDPLDEPFDHSFHQAMFELEVAGKPAGTVVQVMQAGYRLHDRLLRAAMVGVAKAESVEIESPEDGGEGKAGADKPTKTEG